MLIVSGCAQPGTVAPEEEAAKLGVATENISLACGYAWELTAFGGSRPPGLAGVESSAVAGARKLASVYAHDPSDLYQGESVGSIVSDSISLLSECGLPSARNLLQRALARSIHPRGG